MQNWSLGIDRWIDTRKWVCGLEARAGCRLRHAVCIIRKSSLERIREPWMARDGTGTNPASDRISLREIERCQYRHFELLNRGAVSTVRFLNPMPLCDGEIAELTNEWNAVADGVDCRELIVDCSPVRLLDSGMLSKLIVLQRRLNRKNAKLYYPACVPEFVKS